MMSIRRGLGMSVLRMWGAGPARLRSNRIVLCYHNFGDGSVEERGYISSRRCLPIDVFREQMSWLRGVADIVPLGDLRVSSGARLRVAITVDDGYANNVRLAFPALESLGVPATWFVSTGFTDQPRNLPWWDLLDFMIERKAGRVDLRDAGHDICLDLATAPGRRTFNGEVRRALKRARINEREAMLACMREQNPDIEIPCNAFARPDEVSFAIGSGLIEVGGHTMTHPNLASCSREEIRMEVGGGRDRLQEMCGKSPSWFAYPFGGTAAISPEATETIRELGFLGAVSTITGVTESKCSEYMVPRITISPEIGLGEFKALVRGARVFAAIRSRGPESRIS